MIDPSCLPAVAEIVGPEDFALEIDRIIYQAALDLNREGEPIDPVVLKKKAGVISDKYLLNLMEYTLTAANAEMYAKEVRKASMLRKIKALAQSVIEDNEEDPRKIIARLESELEQIETRETSAEIASPDEAMMSFYDHREKVDNGKFAYCPTGLAPIDRILGGGLLQSGLYILAARPGMGKTALALQVMDHIATYGPVLFVSLEMDIEQIQARRIGRVAGLSGNKLLMGRLNEQEYQRVANASDKIRKLPVYINKKEGATVTDISNMARKIKGLVCIVVDYIGKMTPENKKVGRYEYMTEISGDIKTLARKFKVPVLALSQLNRANAERRDKRPSLSDLRDTGAIEQDADGVIFLHREDYYQEKVYRDPWEPSELDIIVEKDRHGATGACKAAFYMVTGRIIPAKIDDRREALNGE
jgi:replicative DNA helicase